MLRHKEADTQLASGKKWLLAFMVVAMFGASYLDSVSGGKVLAWVAGAAIADSSPTSLATPSVVLAAEPVAEPSALDEAEVSDAQFDGFDPAVRFWSRQINTWSQTYNLPANLIATVMQIESCGNPRTISSAGAVGLFQVVPRWHLGPDETATQLFDPQFNAAKGLSFLSDLMNRSGGNIDRALAGYNAGYWALEADYADLPAQTQRMVSYGQMRYPDKRRAIMFSWYRNHGGYELCAAAQAEVGAISR